MRAKFINEKFIEDSDPIKDMGIGSIEKILPLILKNIVVINKQDYSINEINLSKKGLYVDVDSKISIFNKNYWKPIVEDIVETIKNEDIDKYFELNIPKIIKDGEYWLDDEGDYTENAGFFIDFKSDIDVSRINSINISK